jgi:hypothetical protein
MNPEHLHRLYTIPHPAHMGFTGRASAVVEADDEVRQHQQKSKTAIL